MKSTLAMAAALAVSVAVTGCRESSKSGRTFRGGESAGTPAAASRTGGATAPAGGDGGSDARPQAVSDRPPPERAVTKPGERLPGFSGSISGPVRPSVHVATSDGQIMEAQGHANSVTRDSNGRVTGVKGGVDEWGVPVGGGMKPAAEAGPRGSVKAEPDKATQEAIRKAAEKKAAEKKAAAEAEAKKAKADAPGQ